MGDTLSSSYIRHAAKAVGFDCCGVAEAMPQHLFYQRLSRWIEMGGHAKMDYMKRNSEMRADPTLLHPGAKSVICVALGYKPSLAQKGEKRIATYAYGEDYHERVKRMLFQLSDAIRERYPEFEGKACVDTVPIADKWWAMQAGLGWIGRNTLLINPTLGSLCFLGEIVTTSTFDTYDHPVENQCGNCNLCVNACPNGALFQAATPSDSIEESGGYGLNAQRCTSYNTIENKDEKLPDELKTNGYVFGCDYCQKVCPYNQAAPIHDKVPEKRIEELESLAGCDETTFKRLSKHSALSRIKYAQWRRNVEH